jgi:hypothetical protein
MIILSALPTSNADDGGVAVSGGSARLITEHASVSMENEYVKIDMLPDRYKVLAVFNFYNVGDSTSVSVGFPFTGKRTDLRRLDPDLFSFKTSVNGKEVSTEDIDFDKDSRDPSDDIYQYFKVKKVDFPAKSTTTSVVEYVAPYGHGFPANSWVSYNYSTGRSWHGPIHKATFEINFSEDLMGLNIYTTDHNHVVKRSSGTVVFVMDEVKPVEGAQVMVEFHHLEDCFRPYNTGSYCQWPSNDEDGGKPRLKVAKSIIPTLLMLRLKRNYVYAQHGRKFSDPMLSKYFGTYGWYHATNTKDIQLSATELDFVNEIRNEEQEIMWAEPQIQSDCHKKVHKVSEFESRYVLKNNRQDRIALEAQKNYLDIAAKLFMSRLLENNDVCDYSIEAIELISTKGTESHDSPMYPSYGPKESAEAFGVQFVYSLRPESSKESYIQCLAGNGKEAGNGWIINKVIGVYIDKSGDGYRITRMGNG